MNCIGGVLDFKTIHRIEMGGKKYSKYFFFLNGKSSEPNLLPT